MIGQTLSHYRIVEKLGEGGMGVVWKAVDTKLQREVAIKVLPDELSQDEEHLARFEREARLLATLNHRNIATIHGLDEAGGKRFLVMELVEGEDLSRRLIGSPLPVEEAIDIGHQLARALDAAHEKGVLHRDLKPANVQVTPEGRVKVLDFGLAKAFEESGDASKSPTLTSAGTRTGTILGTAGYMSPEQARGKPLDKRTDIWSFGCVLFECLSGRAPFKGETVSDTLASILKTEPNWTLLPERTPRRVRELLQRCLEKDARDRLRDIGDARIELQRSISGRQSLTDLSGALPAAGAETARRGQSFSVSVVAAALVVGAAVGAGGWALLSGSPGSAGTGKLGVTRLSVSYPKDLVVGGTLLSPDGGSVMFAAAPKRSADAERDLYRLYTRRLDRYAIDPVEGSDGVATMAFSPDGHWIAMLTPVTPRSTKLRLSKVPVDASAPPLTLMEWPESWNQAMLWLPNGDLLAKIPEPRAVVRVPTDGSPARTPVEIRTEGFEGDFNFGATASVLPDGIHVLGEAVTYTHGAYEQSVAVLNVETGEVRILVENGSSPQWSPTAHLLFSRSDALLAVPFDVERMAPVGGQVAITDGLRADAIWEDADFQLASDGTLLHWPGGLVGGSRKLVILDPSWEVVGPWSDERRPFEAALAISENGRRLAVTMVNAEGLYDIWISDVDRPRLSMFVHESGRDCTPNAWTPDGDRLVFGCGTTAGGALYIGWADRAGDPELLLEIPSTAEEYWANAFIQDGSTLVLTHSLAGKSELMLLPIESPSAGEHRPAPWLSDAGGARVSPDGRWLSYQSDKSGRTEVYLRPIRPDASLGREIPITRGGGGGADWYTGPGASPLELRYSNRFDVLSVTVQTEPRVTISEPQLVAETSELSPKFRGGLGSLPDGRMIAILRGDDEDPPTEANLVLNWLSELDRRAR